MPIVFALVGLCLIIYAVYVFLRGNAAKTWPQVIGHITVARVDTSESIDSDGDSTNIYKPVVEYTYEVNLKPYTGKRINLVDVSESSPGTIQEKIARYTLGSTVMVYYNPQNPEEACLEPGSIRAALIPFAAGLLFSVIAYAVANT